MATPALLDEQPLAATRAERLRLARLSLQAFLLLCTILSTTLVGMRYMDNFSHARFPLATEEDILPLHWLFTNLRHLGTGLPFSLTLLAILLVHEFAHYGACRAFGIPASLPYLLPAPSLSGTMGAVIRLRARISSRAALLAIGASGPIAGFLVAIITSAVGLALSVPVARTPPHLITLDTPLMIVLLRHLLGHVLHQPATGPLLWHPVLVASWIGLLVTSLNLIPAGQLDGGHILYAISPRAHRNITSLVILSLLLLGIFAWAGWILWMALLLLPAMRHPRVEDQTPLSPGGLAVAPLCLGIFILTATPEPFQQANLLHVIHWLSR